MEFWKRAVISFGKALAFFEAGVDSSVLDCFKKSEATPPNGINQRFPRDIYTSFTTGGKMWDVAATLWAATTCTGRPWGTQGSNPHDYERKDGPTATARKPHGQPQGSGRVTAGAHLCFQVAPSSPRRYCFVHYSTMCCSGMTNDSRRYTLPRLANCARRESIPHAS